MTNAVRRPQFDNSYAALPERFRVMQNAERASAPSLIRLNEGLARDLGFVPEDKTAEDWAEIFAGNAVMPGAAPLAMAYAGHQFGHFVPQLGDGRALLMGEVIGKDGLRYDIQLKGSGRTPFSRSGDGRAALGPVLREYIVSEAMHALGISTTRALAAVLTGDEVYRETALPGAVLTRVARAHVRIGTFQYFAARGDIEGIKLLADYTIERLYPELAAADQPYLALLQRVAEQQAKLVAQWMGAGFIHGVMNTDNMALSGETIDYGPCAFMEGFNKLQVFSSIDQQGRYAYSRQPQLAQWNLARLAECLLPLIDRDSDLAVKMAMPVIEAFAEKADDAVLMVMREKLALDGAADSDVALVRDLLTLMEESAADFTRTFRALVEAADATNDDPDLLAYLGGGKRAADWIAAWRARLAPDAPDRLKAINPLYIPRNHLVEAVIEAGVKDRDFKPFEDLLARVTHPFDEVPGAEKYAAPAQPHEAVAQTFCGT